MVIYEIIRLQNVIPKISVLNFQSTKKSYEAYKIYKSYKDCMVFIMNEMEKIKITISGIIENDDGKFQLPIEKEKEFDQKMEEFCNQEFEWIKEEIDLTMQDVFEAGQAVDDKYKINAEDFENLEKLFREIKVCGNGRRR